MFRIMVYTWVHLLELYATFLAERIAFLSFQSFLSRYKGRAREHCTVLKCACLSIVLHFKGTQTLHFLLSYLHNLCRFGDTNEWSNEPPEPGWTSPLTVSGLMDVGRGERLLGAIAAAVTYSISARPRAASVFWRRTGGSGIGMLSRRSCVACSWRRVSKRASLSPGGRLSLCDVWRTSVSVR